MYEIDLRNFIKTATELTKVYWGVAPDNSGYPRVTLNVVSGNFDYSQDGMDEYNSIIIQVDIWAASYDDSIIVRNKLMINLKTFSGLNNISSIFINAIRQGVDTSSDERLHKQSLDLIVFYK